MGALGDPSLQPPGTDFGALLTPLWSLLAVILGQWGALQLTEESPFRFLMPPWNLLALILMPPWNLLALIFWPWVPCN